MDGKKKEEFVDFNSILLTGPEIQILFGVTRQTVWNWRKQRGFPYKIIRGLRRDDVRYRWKDVVKWAEENQEPMVGRAKLRSLLREKKSETGRI